MSVYLRLSVSVCCSVFPYLFMDIGMSANVCLSVSVCWSVCLGMLSVSVWCLSLYGVYLCLSVAVCLSVYLCLCLCLSMGSVYLCPSLHVVLSISICLCMLACLSLSVAVS